MDRRAFLKVLAVYFLVSFLVLVSNLIPLGSIGSVAIMPGVSSVLLLVPLWIWYRRLVKKTLAKELGSETSRNVLFWVFALFVLALVVRIPAVLVFGMAYEKTSLVYLVVLSVVVLMGYDVTVFGFKTQKFWRAILSGFVYFLILGFLPNILIGVGFYSLSGQLLIEGFDPVPFLFTMPFMTFCVGISEEGLFRGYMQTRLARVYSWKTAVVFQALLFGLWHFVWHVSPLDWIGMFGHVGSTFVIGLIFGYFYRIERNLTPLVLTHGLIDAVPEGFLQNQSASASMQSLPMVTLLLLYVVPYFIAVALTIASTRPLIKAFMQD